MQLTTESIQSLLTDLTLVIQLFVAVVCFFVILVPLTHTFSFHHDGSSRVIAITRTCLKHLVLSPVSVFAYIKYDLWYRWLAMIGWTPVVQLSTDRITHRDSICMRQYPVNPATVPQVSGLVNTGNSCYLNSVLQALSSLPLWHAYLSQQSGPVTDALLKTLRLLTQPLQTRATLCPSEIVAAMSNNQFLLNHDQQDAQEIFQLIVSAVDAESEMTTATPVASCGLKEVLVPKQPHGTTSPFAARLENPVTGLLASRLSCMQCGYTEAIRHFSFNNVQLTLPNTSSTTLEECLTEFTTMEYLSDAACRKCTLINTVSALSVEVDTLQSQAKQTTDPVLKRTLLTRMVALEKQRREIDHRLNVGRIEQDDIDRHMLRTVSRVSSKQVMFAKPPKMLCLHLSRSTISPSGTVYKNTCHIQCPEILDIAPYVTNGTLHTQPHLPISSTSSTSAQLKYRLMAMVVHFGSHDFGHFIAYKRRLSVDLCGCTQCGDGMHRLQPCDEWYRISDEQVDLCSIDQVLQANPYMLLYERVSDEAEQSEILVSKQKRKNSNSGIHTLQNVE